MGCERGRDEDWPWKGESESERCVCVWGGQHEIKGKVGYAERRTETEKSSERWSRQRKREIIG